MRYLAAYCLCVLGGNANPTESDITGVLSEMGIEAPKDKVSAFLALTKGKTCD